MALGFRMGGAGEISEPEFKSDGLSPVSNRATVLSGGYRFVDDVCEIDVVFKTLTTVPNGATMIDGFPRPIDSVSGFFGPTMSNCRMYASSTIGIISTASIASNTTIHYVYSYKWR